MLVQSTPISSLTQQELQQLKMQVNGMRLESSQAYYNFNGKTISMNELQAHQRMWESDARKAGGQPLFG
jgi:hypothetical protein